MASMPRAARDEYFDQLSPRGRALLLTAIFFTFATFGPLFTLGRVDIEHEAWWTVFVWSLFSGGVAIGWALSFMWRLWLLPFVIVLQVGGPIVLGPAMNAPWLIDSRSTPLAAMAILTLVAGYVLMATFVAKEGSRQLRLRTEMNLAQGIHRSLVPPLHIETASAEAAARSDASSEMGGDLIDVLTSDRGLDAYLADVSGHGVRAGVLMAMLKSSLRTRLLHDDTLEHVLPDLNRVVCDLAEPGMFATFACIRLADDGRATCALAGHLPILHVVASTGDVRRIENQSLPLGVQHDETFAVQEISLAPDDLLVIYTDGLTESRNKDGLMLGEAPLIECLQRHRAEPVDDVLQSLLELARSHGAQDDDQSVIVVRRR